MSLSVVTGGAMRPSGDLVVRKLAAPGGPKRRAPAWAPMPRGLTLRRQIATFNRELGLHLRMAGKGFWRGLVAAGGVSVTSRLHLTHWHCTCYDPWTHLPEPCPQREVEPLGLKSTKLITDAGVAFLVDDWDNNGTDLTTLNFHGIGTGTNAEAVGDTALQTESTTALNPDNTRATGTRSQPAANQYRTVGTLTADATIACTEHGIFSQAATGGGTLWDRSVFSVVNLAIGDSLQATYTATLNSGG